MKIFLKKIKEVEDAVVPNNIPEDYSTVREVHPGLFKEPEVGECFYVGTFRTSPVTEIVSKNCIRTLNSIYQWEIVGGVIEE